MYSLCIGRKDYARGQIESDRCPENILYKPSDEEKTEWSTFANKWYIYKIK